MDELDELRAANENLRHIVWLQGSRLNCVLIDAPPLPKIEDFRSSSDFLRACEHAIDQRMHSTILMKARPLPDLERAISQRRPG